MKTSTKLAKATREAKNYAKELIKLAKKERDTKGYRENLGYDSDHKLEDFLNKFNFTYQQRFAIMKQFYMDCRSI